MYTIFTRKAGHMDEAQQYMHNADPRQKEWVEITERIELTPEQYDAFWSEPSGGTYPFLIGKGGYQNGERTAVLLTCGARSPIIVDPSGSDYGRYVGFEVQ